MALDLPDSTVVTGKIEIATVLKENGDDGLEFGFEDMSADAAIGHLTVVLDRMREERKYVWETDPATLEVWGEGEDE